MYDDYLLQVRQYSVRVQGLAPRSGLQKLMIWVKICSQTTDSFWAKWLTHIAFCRRLTSCWGSIAVFYLNLEGVKEKMEMEILII